MEELGSQYFSVNYGYLGLQIVAASPTSKSWGMLDFEEETKALVTTKINCFPVCEMRKN